MVDNRVHLLILKILCRQECPNELCTDAINCVSTQQNAQQKMSEQDYGIVFYPTVKTVGY